MLGDNKRSAWGHGQTDGGDAVKDNKGGRVIRKEDSHGGVEEDARSVHAGDEEWRSRPTFAISGTKLKKIR